MTAGIVLRGAALAALAALAACSSGTTSSASSSPAASGAPAPGRPGAPAGARTTVKIGIDMPLSGADASDGQPTANGAILAMEQADARGFAGGRFTVQPDLLDDAVQGKHDPAAGAQNVKTFIGDSSVLAMIGPFNSNVAKSEIPLTNDAGLAQIAPSTVADGLTVGPEAAALRESHPDLNAFFRVCTRDSRQGAALAAYALKRGWKRIYVIDDNETYGKDLADVFVADLGAHGGTVLGRDHVTANQQDFRALLTKAKSLAPQAIFFGGTSSTGGGLIRRQMADAGMRVVPYIGGDGISDETFVQQAGDMADGTYYAVAAPDALKLTSARAFVAAYRKRFGAAPGPYSANAYAAAEVALAAIEKAIAGENGGVPTRAEVLRAVSQTRGLPTPIGPIGFDAHGDTTSPILTLVEITGGKPRTVDQIVLPES